MNPLLVTYNKQYNTDVGTRNLANLRVKFDCDIMTLTVNPKTVKKITRATFHKMGSIYWHCLWHRIQPALAPVYCSIHRLHLVSQQVACVMSGRGARHL